jgi:hypothetical protein
MVGGASRKSALNRCPPGFGTEPTGRRSIPGESDPSVSLIVYGDSCSGIPGTVQAGNLARIHEQILRVEPRPPLLVFMGDHIAGHADAEELRRQWRHFFSVEFPAVAAAFPVAYHITSNHSLFDRASLAVWREVFGFLPDNGPPGLERLAYWVRHGDLLLIFVNTLGADPTGEAQIECDWLADTLNANSDAAIKLVFGHHPIHPVNGYTRYPMWRADPADGVPFWDVLVGHRVAAYFCSHIIAYDVQVHRGVLQICTAGAGTRYGPAGAMPGRSEYLHFVEASVMPESVAVASRDADGRLRETMRWPFALPAPDDWIELAAPGSTVADLGFPESPGSGKADLGGAVSVGLGLRAGAQLGEELGQGFVAWSLGGSISDVSLTENQILFCGWAEIDAAPRIEIGTRAGTGRLVLSLVLELGRPPVVWLGPVVPANRTFDLILVIRPCMGPGGCLFRTGETQSWSSMECAAAEGAAGLLWPDHWSIGHGPSGLGDRPFRGSGLALAATVARSPTSFEARPEDSKASAA